MSNIDDNSRQELQEYARGGAAASAHGHALVQPTKSIAPIGAQPVARLRDEATIKRKLAELGAMAGEEWFYRYPVKDNRTKQTTWIEGPSIKLANTVHRIVGNNIVEVREVDVGDAYVFYARLTDLESGSSMERAYRQRKGQQTIGTKDPQRAMDQVYQIGQSKAIRNVVVNALAEYADWAFDQAQGSLVEKIGKDLESWRTKTLNGLARIPIDVRRVEHVMQRSAKDWLAADIARIIAMGKAIADGMATVDETFPEPPEPDKQTAPAGSAPHANQEPTPTQQEAAPASPSAPPDTASEPSSDKITPQLPTTSVEYFEHVAAICAAAGDAAELKQFIGSEQHRQMRLAAKASSRDVAAAQKMIDERCRQLEQ